MVFFLVFLDQLLVDAAFFSAALSRERLATEIAACAATAAPTTPAAVPPISSALASMPKAWMSVRRS
ncbi:hypothetical protein D9M69_646200 [compost metagenome]